LSAPALGRVFTFALSSEADGPSLLEDREIASEFYFTDVLWPAFRKVDFLRAIRAYQARNRRFSR
jgi:hypothetical protein